LKSPWNLLGEVNTGNTKEIEASVHVPVDSPWFQGHFPGEPILPGIALVHMAEQAILQHTRDAGEKIQPYALRRVRFIQPVRPGEALSLNISSEDTGKEILFSFKVANKENIVCSGLIIAKKMK
jgi:3-hydroxymyristoyl/3-hydroxydecanoyl-(acyl carrier protein) dehydratase